MIQLVQEKLMDILEDVMTQHRPFNHDGIDISRTHPDDCFGAG